MRGVRDGFERLPSRCAMESAPAAGKSLRRVIGDAMDSIVPRNAVTRHAGEGQVRTLETGIRLGRSQ